MHAAYAILAFSALLTFDPAFRETKPEEAGDLGAEESTLRAAGLITDGPTLLQFFRTRTRSETDPERLQALARKLDASPSESSRAAAELLAQGPVAIPALRFAVHSLESPRRAEQARRCLDWLEGSRRTELPRAAARLLAARKPAGAAETLLAYLPFADDAAVIEAVRNALGTLARSGQGAQPVLVRALQDPLPLRRVVALEALHQGGRDEAAPAARQLLKDANPAVRLRAAVALTEQQDAEAVPVLIELLAELPPADRRQAEEALQLLAGEWAPNPSLAGEDDVSRRLRREVWAAWWRQTDGETLLATFRKHTLHPDDHDKVRALVEQLGDRSFEARERAVKELVILGPKAAPLLRQAARGSDLEKARRAEACLAQIAEGAVKLPLAAARLLALRQPAGAAETLLAYLPFAEGEQMAEEISTALKTLTVRAGKADAALLRALGDAVPLRRAVAAEALARAGLSETLPEVRKLLGDTEPSVRLRTALALVRARDREAVPVLIRVVGEVPADQGWQALDLLYQLAGESAPQLPPGDDAQTARKRRDAWTEWWGKHGAQIDLARLTNAVTLLGYTLLTQVDQNTNSGRVVELGRDGKVRWQIDNLQFPVDAQMIGENRVLIAEYNGRRVTERDLKGKVLWQKENLPGSAINVQRLRNGNTFIATENTLLEVNAAGSNVFSFQVPGNVTAAYKQPDGQIVCLTQQGRCVRFDEKGKELKGFASGRGGGWTSGLDLLPNGRILIAMPDRGSVVEFDADGKQLWQVNAPNVTTATRTPNGHTLVASFDGRRVYELDRAGKQVWEHRDNFGVFRARRR